MSEKKSIEERYERIRRELERDGCFRAIYLLDDLMAERGKMKERTMKAQGELIELSEALDAWGHPATAGQLMGIHDILEDK